jgi:outer membrane protein TolC
MFTIRKLLFMLMLLPAELLLGQDTLTIEACYRLAEKNWPLVRQVELIAGSNELKVKNLNKNFLPQSAFNVNISYQSDVTQVAIPLPAGFGPLDMPEISKDWYKATLDVNQAIYDGHVTGYSKRLEKFNLEVDQTAVQSELYKLKERVNQIYFSILLFHENEKLLASNREQVSAKLREAEAGVRNGAVLQMNADILKAELIRIEQLTDESVSDRTSAVNMLAQLTGSPISPATVFITPAPLVISYLFENKRLEDRVFTLQESRLTLQRDMVTTKWNPKVYAYGQAGYGRPSLNMLDNDFKPWGLIGVKLNWTFWNWNANKNEKKILEIQGDIVRSQQEAFDRNLRIQSEKDLGEIEKAEKLLTKDAEIIDLRIRVTRAASSQLDNGVIPSSDYISRLKEETQAKLSYEIHKLQLVRAKMNYLYNQGKL